MNYAVPRKADPKGGPLFINDKTRHGRSMTINLVAGISITIPLGFCVQGELYRSSCEVHSLLSPYTGEVDEARVVGPRADSIEDFRRRPAPVATATTPTKKMSAAKQTLSDAALAEEESRRAAVEAAAQEDEDDDGEADEDQEDDEEEPQAQLAIKVPARGRSKGKK